MADDRLVNKIKLSSEQIARLNSARDEIKAAKKALEPLRKLGMDVSEIESQVKWAEDVQDTLLKEFS